MNKRLELRLLTVVRAVLLQAALLVASPAFGEPSMLADDVTEDVADESSEDLDIRLNPENDAAADTLTRDFGLYSDYPFLNLAVNHINMNGADWTSLRGRFKCADDTVISIVHIGDSHLQADISSGRTRELLQSRFGSAGRGLIIPFKLAGTNEPADYKLVSSSQFTTARLLKQPWATDMGFTGISLQPKRTSFGFAITATQKGEIDPSFDYLRIFSQGSVPVVKSVASLDGRRIEFESQAVADTVYVYLSDLTQSVNVELESAGRCNIFGFDIGNSDNGVIYNTIGNNGATYSTYNGIGRFASSLRAFSPSLVIVSLGTNEAFSKISESSMYSEIDQLVRSIRSELPDAQLLLVTPAECQRSQSSSRRRRRRARSYHVNDRVSEMRNVILRYGFDKGIPTYDFYAVAGGDGSSTQWLEYNLLGGDRIHLTRAGYLLNGTLLFDALINAIEQ